MYIYIYIYVCIYETPWTEEPGGRPWGRKESDMTVAKQKQQLYIYIYILYIYIYIKYLSLIFFGYSIVIKGAMSSEGEKKISFNLIYSI